MSNLKENIREMLFEAYEYAKSVEVETRDTLIAKQIESLIRRNFKSRETMHRISDIKKSNGIGTTPAEMRTSNTKKYNVWNGPQADAEKKTAAQSTQPSEQVVAVEPSPVVQSHDDAILFELANFDESEMREYFSDASDIHDFVKKHDLKGLHPNTKYDKAIRKLMLILSDHYANSQTNEE